MKYKDMGDLKKLEENCEYGGLSDNGYCGYLKYWESINHNLCNHKLVPRSMANKDNPMGRGARDCRNTEDDPCVFKITKDEINKQ